MREWLGFMICLPFTPLILLEDAIERRRYKRVRAEQRQLEIDLAEGE